MHKVQEVISKLESLLQDTEAWCDSTADRTDARLDLEKLTLDLEMEIEIANNGDYSSRLSRFKACVNDMFAAESLSSKIAVQNRDWAMEQLYVLKRAAEPMA